MKIGAWRDWAKKKDTHTHRERTHGHQQWYGDCWGREVGGGGEEYTEDKWLWEK